MKPRAALIGLGVLFCGLLAPRVWADTQAAVAIKVSADQATPMPYLFRTGVFTFNALPPRYVRDLLLHELKPGTVEIDVGEIAFKDADNATDLLRRLAVLAPWLRDIVAAGGEPVIAFTEVPLWLSSRPNAREAVKGDIVRVGNVSPPQDPKAWSALIAQVVRYFKDELKLNLRYKVGWEPDQGSWQGTEQQFFEFYRDTVRGVRMADPHAKVGGPSVSALYNSKAGPQWPPMLYRFLAYCGKTPLPEISATRIPIDFIVWDQFNTDFLTSWSAAADQIRAWMKQFGYAADTQLLVGEWSSWEQWPSNSSSEQDDPFIASYIISSLYGMDRAGIDRAAFTSLLEQREVEGEQFIGSFGLVTNQFIKKPSFWAFKSLAMLGTQRLSVDSSHPMVVAIAGRAGVNDLAVVIADHPLAEKVLMHAAIGGLLAKGYALPDLQAALRDENTIVRLLRGERAVSDLHLPDKLASDLGAQIASMQQQHRLADELARAPAKIHLAFAHLPWSAASYQIYRIDSQHTNPKRVRREINNFVKDQFVKYKATLEPDITDRLDKEGYDSNEVAALKEVLGQADKEAALARLPGAQQSRVAAMARSTESLIHERFGQIGEAVNQWPQVMMTPTASGQIDAAGGHALDIEMEPYSVVLIKLHKN